MEPDREYDLYCERREREYRALVEGMTCLDCGNACEGDDHVLRCLETGEAVREGDNPVDLECEVFEL